MYKKYTLLRISPYTGQIWLTADNKNECYVAQYSANLKHESKLNMLQFKSFK